MRAGLRPQRHGLESIYGSLCCRGVTCFLSSGTFIDAPELLSKDALTMWGPELPRSSPCCHSLDPQHRVLEHNACTICSGLGSLDQGPAFWLTLKALADPPGSSRPYTLAYALFQGVVC